MVKTRHSDELLPTTAVDPEFMSLNNEKQRRQVSTKKADNAESNLHTSRAYNTDGSNAFNIFEEKVVDSRLRPRTGPRRAHNYIDADSSEDDVKENTRRFSRRKRYSYSQSDRDSPDRLHQRQIKRELLEEQGGRSRCRRNFKQRSPSPDEESDRTDDDEERSRKNSLTQYHNRSLSEHDFSLRTKRRSASKQSFSPDHKEKDQIEEETINVRQRSTRLSQKQPQNSSDEEQKPSRRKSFRTRMTCDQNDREEQEEDDEDVDVRRSSRKRRQIFDTLNQSYIVNMPGRRKQGNNKDEDSENNETEEEEDGNNQEFSDMYSRVKRKRVQVKRNMYGVPIDDESESEENDENENNNNDNEEEDDEEDVEENEQHQSGRVLRKRKSIRRPQPQKNVKSYSLRQHKPRTVLYKAPVAERRVRRVEQSVFVTTPTKTTSKQPYQSPAHRRKIRKKSAFHSSSSSTSSSDSENSDEKSFKRRKDKSMAKARNRMMPMNMTADTIASSSVLKDRVKSGVSLADVEPMTIDKSVTFDSIGGLGKHIRKLKEMVVFPLLYDKVFQRFKVDPPRGVLFYGPPGTGKTLVARALANECSQGDRRVAFFMRKGADCLSKWVGESERQLRLLFDQAYKFRPSIIFFDEIDGLAPVRSSRQDQIHSSIVSTLLALMDGLDSRGEIVVIGATNRIDSLDPALRRPGRFDREFLFPLPSLEARKQILKIHTSSWNPRLNDSFLTELAEKCVGYCGADLKALCSETAMQALRRRYPQIYLTNEALQLDVSSINVSARDFYNAIVSIIPTSQRSISTPARALPAQLLPLLEPQLDDVMSKLGDIFPASLQKESSFANAATLNQAKELAESGIPWDELLSDEEEDAPSIFMPSTSVKWSKTSKSNPFEHGLSSSKPVPTYLNFTSCATTRPTIFRPRLMLVGCEGQGQTTHLAPAVIHQMENLPCHVLDLPTLYAVTAKTPEESCANVFHEAKRKCPSILYLPYMDQWWDVMADTLRATLLTLIQDLDPALPLLLLATSERPYHMLDPTLRSLFSTYSSEVSLMRNPNKEERRGFFKDLLLTQASKAPPQKKQAAQRMLETLPLAAPAKPRDLSQEELALLEEKEELTLMELRIFLRDVLNKLGTDKKFSIFAKPVNIEDAADYYDIIEHPMDLSSMMAKIDLHEYSTVRHFLNDIDLICSNALEYNPDRGPMDRVIRHRACALKDTAYAIIKTELDKEFEKTCAEIQESRKRRGQKSSTVPNFYNTRLKHGNSSRSQATTAPTTSYLDKPQMTRSIPKPDGERFSRRVRGLDTDPVQPLETVEKVYKSSRSTASPSREKLSNSNGKKESKDDDSVLSKKEEMIEDNENQSDSDTPKQASDALQQLENSVNQETTENNAASSVSNSKKKRSACVWCRPRRKRRRLNLSKADKAEGAEKDMVGESNEEDEGDSVDDEEEKEKDMVSKTQAPSTSQVDQQLAIDTSESAQKRMDGKTLDTKTKSTCSPASIPLGVTTRRSSMSPRISTSIHSPKASNYLCDEKLNTDTPVKETDPDIVIEGKISKENVNGLLKKSPNECSSSTQSQDQTSNSGAKLNNQGGLTNKDRPSVVKRLDLDMVITDSGHGSSLESNGDSRDSTDHKDRMRVEGESPISKSLPAIEALVNVNDNCSSDLGTTATSILAAPNQTVITDVPRMTQLLTKLVGRTDGYTIERLEKIYSQLSQIIYRHRHNFNKLPLMEAMECKLEDLTAQTSAGTSKQ